MRVISTENLTSILKRLKFPNLKYRRTRGDMIEVYKINTIVERQQDSITRGRSLKLEIR